jgi:hypothetical protein
VQRAERVVLNLKVKGSVCETIPVKTKAKSKSISFADWQNFTGKLQAKNGLLDPHRPPDVHHKVRLTGRFDNITGEWLPDFSINDQPLRLWPAFAWCKVRDDIDKKESVKNSVLQMRFCQGRSKSEIRETNIDCAKFKSNGTCPAPRFKSTADGRCIPNGVIDAWHGVPVEECDQWKIEPKQFHYNPNALEVCHGDRVWLTYEDDHSGEGHPIHLHGTHQQLIKVNGHNVVGPYRDTWFMVQNHSITVAF